MKILLLLENIVRLTGTAGPGSVGKVLPGRMKILTVFVFPSEKNTGNEKTENNLYDYHNINGRICLV